MTELDLDIMAIETWCIWLKKSVVSDFQHTEQPLNAISRWLGQLRIAENVMEFVFSQRALYVGSSFQSVLRWIGNIRSFFTCSRFPYEEERTNEWFNLELPDDSSQREDAVKAINIKEEEGATEEGSTILAEVKNYLQSLSDTDNEVLFHGTSHESAQDIIEKGIDVRKGNPKQDFSNGDGFYLGDSFDEARRWPRSHGHRNPAVIVFRVKTSELRSSDGKYLDLRDDKKYWQEIISQFRCGRPDKKFLKDIKKYDFIEGPMASMSSKNPNAKYPKQKDGTYQLCIRKDNCAEFFDKNLHAVVFF